MILYYVNEIPDVTQEVLKFQTWPHRHLSKRFLTIGNSYEGDLTPTIYDVETLDVVDPSYVIKCDDGRFRKFDAEYFITEQEWKKMNRDNKLKELRI